MAKKKLGMQDLLEASVKNFKTITAKPEYERFTTGSPYLDRILSGSPIGGGLPRGGIIEVSGHFSSGKTTFALSCCRRVLDQCPDDEGVVFFDYENSVDKRYAKRAFGLNLDNSDPRVLYLQPLTITHAREVMAKFFKMSDENGHCPIRLIVFDSVAAMNPEAFMKGALEGEKGKQIGLQARELSQLFGEFSGLFAKHNVTILLTNQLRAVIKLSQYQGGPDEDTTGGNALKFYCWIRMTLKKKEKVLVKGWDPITGEMAEREMFSVIEVSTIKNKTAAPYLKDRVHIRYGSGYDNAYTTVMKGMSYGLFHPDSKNSMADKERYKQKYITGDGKSGFTLWKYEKGGPNNVTGEPDDFFVQVEDKKNTNGMRIVKKTAILTAKSMVEMAEKMVRIENGEAWDYLLSEVIRQYVRDEELYMTPSEKAEAHTYAEDSEEVVENAESGAIIEIGDGDEASSESTSSDD